MINILICLLFKNSNLWLNRFMECIDLTLSNKPDNINYNLSIIYGDSNDGTDENLNIILNNLQNKYKVNIKRNYISLPNRLDGIQKLVTLRNSFLYINNNDLKKYDYIIPIDTDIIFNPFTIKKLIKDISNPRLKAGIVAPMIFIDNYRRQRNDYFYDTFAYRKDGEMFLHKNYYLPNNKLPDKRIIELDSVGSFYIMRADIITKYNILYGTEKRKNTEKHPQRKYESEQVILCNEVRTKTPYKVYVDLYSKVYHINLEDYGLAWH